MGCCMNDVIIYSKGSDSFSKHFIKFINAHVDDDLTSWVCVISTVCVPTKSTKKKESDSTL